MQAIATYIESVINKLVYPLKSGKELELSLKTKLTKKEYKLLSALANNQEPQECAQLLKVDSERLEQIKLTLHKKLNQEKIKQQITQR